MPSQHKVTPLSIRFPAAERERLGAYAERHGLPVRQVILAAVRAWLDGEAQRFGAALDERQAELRERDSRAPDLAMRERLGRMSDAQAWHEAHGTEDPEWESLWDFTDPERPSEFEHPRSGPRTPESPQGD